MTTYATVEQLRARIDPTYAAFAAIADDDDAEKLLLKASELIDEHTLNRAPAAWDAEEGYDEEDQVDRLVLAKATCDQVEFWLEVGPEHDVAGLKGSVVAGRLQVHPVANTLAPRAKRTLLNGGLYWAGAAIG